MDSVSSTASIRSREDSGLVLLSPALCGLIVRTAPQFKWRIEKECEWGGQVLPTHAFYCPVPARVTVWTFEAASSVTLKFALNGPVFVGAKVTVMVQL